jgi:integrase/recombinase XerD
MFEHVDPSENLDQWIEAYSLWLASRRAENTRRAYEAAWQDLLRSAGKGPWILRKADLARWCSEMDNQGLRPATIAQRMAAISSFYNYANQIYTIEGPDGEEIPLHHTNPARAVQRPRVHAYAEAIYLTADEARQLLAAVDRSTVTGRRNYAMLLGYLLTGKRNTELRLLRWGDLEKRGQTVWYQWTGKGKSGRKQLPPPVYTAIVDYLQASGRMRTIHRAGYIFTGLADSPITMQYANQVLKRYAALAGLDPARIHIHTLRHTAASLRLEAGDDIKSIQQYLDHSSATTTDRYVHRLVGQADSSWRRVGQLLGVG